MWGRVRAAWLAQLLLFGYALWSGSAAAQEEPNHGVLGIESHGFVSQGFIYTTKNQFLAKSSDGSFQFSEVGVNFTKQLTDKLRVGVQVFAHDLGPVGNYKPTFDWFFLDYHFFDWFGVRVGRTKIPFGLYNETSDIDAARAPILLPQSTYSLQNRDYLLAQTGIDLYGYVSLGSAGALDYRLFGGTIFYEPPDPQPGVQYSVPYIGGGRAQWLTPIDGLSAAFSVLTVRLNQEVPVDAATAAALKMQGFLSQDFGGVVKLGLPIWIMMGSLEYQAHDLQLAFEYQRSRIDLDTNQPLLNKALYPDGVPYPTYGMSVYGMASYRLTPWFMPGVYYAATRPDLDKSGRRDYHRNDLALFFRGDITPNWLIKIEGHYMNGTAGLDPKLNGLAGDDDLKTLARQWGVFLVKTTAYF